MQLLTWLYMSDYRNFWSLKDRSLEINILALKVTKLQLL